MASRTVSSVSTTQSYLLSTDARTDGKLRRVAQLARVRGRRLANVEFLLGGFVDLHGDWRKLSIINGDDLTGIPSLLLSFEVRRQTV